MSLYSMLTVIFAMSLILFSAAEIGLDSYVLRYYTVHSSRPNLYYLYNIGAVYTSKDFLPSTSVIRSYGLQLATGTVGIAVGVIIYVICLRSKRFTFTGTGKRAPRQLSWPIVVTVIVLLYLCLSLPNLILTFVDDSKYGFGSIEDMSPCQAALIRGGGSAGCILPGSDASMTIEGWTCRLTQAFFSDSVSGRLVTTVSLNAGTVVPRTCTVSRLARWWTIALFVLPVFMLATSFLESRRQNIANYNAQSGKQTDDGLYPHDQPSFSSSVRTAVVPVSMTGDSPVSPMSPHTELHGGKNGAFATEVRGKQIYEAPGKIDPEEMPGDRWQVYSELPATKSKDVLDR